MTKIKIRLFGIVRNLGLLDLCVHFYPELNQKTTECKKIGDIIHNRNIKIKFESI
ncbi:hypothetical protein EDC42_1468 [Methanobrevibacter gottschalkii DSM 11977]|uniref:Uncharacterized protein n=1 Tax=Methanobrevibacter gottschalkii DSM 11977 TaxID=1122229 RepID=A0A3N5BTH7_9EURY|nr:hypothetical protein EDC42_1468 [Methanobrevibacter gottschalkii DSM 11977]